MARSVIVIPGIGGHPRFHESFIEALGGTGDVMVLSWPHGDFFTQPFDSISQHAAYWSERIAEALRANKTGEEVSLAAISFGGAVACALPSAVLQSLHRGPGSGRPWEPVCYFRIEAKC